MLYILHMSKNCCTFVALFEEVILEIGLPFSFFSDEIRLYSRK